MDKATASLVLQAALDLDAPINKLCAHIKAISDEQEKDRLIKAIGEVMGVLTRDFVFPITAQYPELNPDNL